MENVTKLVVNTGAMLIDVENEKGRKIGEFEIIPTDVDILNRYEQVADFFNAVEFSESPETKELMDFAEKIKEQFDFLFNYKVSDGLFSQCSPLTILTNGDFYFENVMEGIVGLIEKITDQRVKKKIAKVRKATAKYHA